MSGPINGTSATRWLSIGLFAMFLIAIGGWAFGAFKAAEVRGIIEIRSMAAEAKALATQNDREIAILKTQYASIILSLQEIKELVKEHTRQDARSN
jgi:hypothetical protein